MFITTKTMQFNNLSNAIHLSYITLQIHSITYIQHYTSHSMANNLNIFVPTFNYLTQSHDSSMMLLHHNIFLKIYFRNCLKCHSICYLLFGFVQLTSMTSIHMLNVACRITFELNFLYFICVYMFLYVFFYTYVCVISIY